MNIKDPQKFQRIAFGFIIFIAVFTILLGVIQFYSNIAAPFPTPSGQLAVSQDQSKNLEELKSKDTDLDGLSDFDELYLYNTSPYLEDSDSDGKSDRTEVEAGADPNCPEGQDCRGFSTNENQNTNTNAATAPKSFDLNELREALRGAGASETVLNQVDDETLIELYNEVVAENPELAQGINLNASNANTNISTEDYLSTETLKNFTPDEIREFLVLGGADEELLNQVDDQTLQEIYLQALEDQSGS